MTPLVTVASVNLSEEDDDANAIHVSPAMAVEDFLAWISKKRPGWQELEVTIIRDAATLEALTREFPDPTAP